MIYKRAITAVLAVFLFISVANAQRAEVTISLSEAFFDALLDSVYSNFDPPEFSIASREPNNTAIKAAAPLSFFPSSTAQPAVGTPFCSESVKLLREMSGVRTAVRFREGKIFVPLAFSGTYNPPFIGCIEFAGWAESVIDLEFDQNTQKLIGRVRVLNVNLNGAGGLGGSVIARLIQSSIDKKLNPIEIISLDKVSFAFPVQKAGNIRMKAHRIRPEVVAGAVNIRVEYEFLKG